MTWALAARIDNHQALSSRGHRHEPWEVGSVHSTVGCTGQTDGLRPGRGAGDRGRTTPTAMSLRDLAVFLYFFFVVSGVDLFTGNSNLLYSIFFCQKIFFRACRTISTDVSARGVCIVGVFCTSLPSRQKPISNR